MEDGPEEAAGRYAYNGKSYRLDERESMRWRVLDDGVHIGTIFQLDPTRADGVLYTIQVADGRGPEAETTDDWERALETLIDLATF